MCRILLEFQVAVDVDDQARPYNNRTKQAPREIVSITCARNVLNAPLTFLLNEGVTSSIADGRSSGFGGVSGVGGVAGASFVARFFMESFVVRALGTRVGTGLALRKDPSGVPSGVVVVASMQRG